MAVDKNNIQIDKNQNQSKVALVHDFLLYPGGAEKVLADLTKIFPKAPIYTLLYNKDQMKGQFSNKNIRTSFLQKWPNWLKKRHKLLIPFFGTAMESFDLREFDLVISSSGAWSKGIVTRLNTRHIAYIHSPMRYVWDENEHYLKKIVNKKNHFCIRLLLSYLRVWDYQAAQRPDILIANSKYTKERIEKYYRRKSSVICPAATLNVDDINKDRDGFVVISRLSKYKNVALTVEVCNKLQLPLTVIGEGNELMTLTKIAGKTIKILGYISEKEKIKYLQRAEALLFPTEDDFGIVCIEAMQTGTPVIALNRGGGREIVIPGITGELFDAPTVEMLADAIRRFLEKKDTYDRCIIKAESQKYTFNRFEKQFRELI